MTYRDQILAELLARKVIVKQIDTIGVDRHTGERIRKCQYHVCDEKGRPSNSVVIEWKFIKEYEHFNLWETVNTHEDEWTGIGSPLNPKNCIPRKRLYKECFYKDINPNDELYYRKGNGSYDLISLRKYLKGVYE